MTMIEGPVDNSGVHFIPKPYPTPMQISYDEYKMSEPIINILSALAVSAIITAMAKVRSQKLKSILYVLPFPITIALIGSDSIASSLSILGIVLTGFFLWGCHLLHHTFGVKIFYADALLALLYVALAYLLAQTVNISLWNMMTIFLVMWFLLMMMFKDMVFSYRAKPPTSTNAWLKAITIFGIAFILFSAHQYLAAFVVTFPYNGVFAVYENRAGLLPQAALFTRNSLALAAYFLANYLVGTHYSATLRYAVSWFAFGIVIVLVNKFVKIHVKDLNEYDQRKQIP